MKNVFAMKSIGMYGKTLRKKRSISFDIKY